jgi:hypothetical protein
MSISKYNLQISEESSNPQHFNWQKAVNKKLCFTWEKNLITSVID